MWMLPAESCLQIDKCALLNSLRYRRGAGYLLNLLWQVVLAGRSCLLGCFDVTWLPVDTQGCFRRDLILGIPRQRHTGHWWHPGRWEAQLARLPPADL